MMKSVSTQELKLAKFLTLGHAVAFFNERNPARARSVNLLEPGSSSTTTHPDFDENHPEVIWSGIAVCISKTMRASNYIEVACWKLRNLGDRSFHHDVTLIAEKLRLTSQQVYRNLRRVNDQLRAELIARELLEPDERIH